MSKYLYTVSDYLFFMDNFYVSIMDVTLSLTTTQTTL